MTDSGLAGVEFGIVVLGLPLGQGELGLLGELVVIGPGIVAGGGQDLLELQHVGPSSPGARDRKKGTVPGLGDGVATVEGEHGLAGLGESTRPWSSPC